jgi:hypothetical protein
MEHDHGDEDRRPESSGACELCGERMRRYEARKVPLLSVDGGFETAVICAADACRLLAVAVYRQSCKRNRWRQDEMLPYAAEMIREATP